MPERESTLASTLVELNLDMTLYNYDIDDLEIKHDNALVITTKLAYS